MKLFGKKNKDDKEVRKPCLLISVLNGEAGPVVVEDFEIPVSQAIALILKKLKLPVEAGEGMSMKYFLFRPTTKTEDGFEIIAEIDQQGNPLILNEYGIFDGTKLNLGAIVLPKQEGNINTETNKTGEEDTVDKDFEFEEEYERPGQNDEMFEI